VNRRTLLSAVGSAGLAFAALGPRVVLAKAASGTKVNIRLMVVHATNENGRVDKRLERIAKHLKNLRYSGFSLLGDHSAQLAQKGKQTFSITSGRKVSVTVLSRDDKRARVRVEVHGKKGKLVDTTVGIRRNSFFMVAGPKYKGGILILPIFARY